MSFSERADSAARRQSLSTMGDGEDLSGWIGRELIAQDVAALNPVMGLMATLGRGEAAPSEGDAAPLLSHWLYFLDYAAQQQLGPDGHRLRGGFLPPATLPRRMWAGSRIQFFRPITLGANLERRSRIADVQQKSGRSGRLVFVRVDHEVRDQFGAVLTESQDLVYRSAPSAFGPEPAFTLAPDGPDWSRRIDPDPVLLFRYSALTFNSHRIHYDQTYATAVEGYPGLVVHGPLIATLLLEALTEHLPEATLSRFSFRAVRPIFHQAPFWVCGAVEGAEVRLFARTADGALCMEASARLR